MALSWTAGEAMTGRGGIATGDTTAAPAAAATRAAAMPAETEERTLTTTGNSNVFCRPINALSAFAAAALHPAAARFVGARRYGGLNSTSEDPKGAP